MVIAAVRRVLEDEPYKSRMSFELYELPSERGKEAERIYPFGRDRHGLVVLDARGDLVHCQPGHFYGEVEILEIFDDALGIKDD